jgi:hypothetical protein
MVKSQEITHHWHMVFVIGKNCDILGGLDLAFASRIKLHTINTDCYSEFIGSRHVLLASFASRIGAHNIFM